MPYVRPGYPYTLLAGLSAGIFPLAIQYITNESIFRWLVIYSLLVSALVCPSPRTRRL